MVDAKAQTPTDATQSLVIKRYNANLYGTFDATPQIYAGLYDMTEADRAANVVNGIVAVHQLRPDFKALLYQNMRCVQTSSAAYTTFLNNGWLLRDTSGALIKADVPNSYLVDVGNSAYQTWMGNYINSAINGVGYDGVFADNSLFWGPDLFWGISVTPVNPRTSRPWTDAECRQALIGLQRAIKSAIGSKLLLCNDIYDGQRFYWHQSAYEEILSSSPLDGFMSQGGWYPIGDRGAIWVSEEQWLKELEFTVYVQNNFLNGHPERFYVPICVLRNSDGTSVPLPPGCTQQQLATYAYASTLLGAKTNQNYLGFFAGANFTSQFIQPLYDLDVGTPINDYYMVAGTHVYSRDLTKVKVLVNPTNQPYSLELTKNYETIGGQIISSITVEAHTGVILKDSLGPPQIDRSVILQDDFSSGNLASWVLWDGAGTPTVASTPANTAPYAVKCTAASRNNCGIEHTLTLPSTVHARIYFMFPSLPTASEIGIPMTFYGPGTPLVDIGDVALYRDPTSLQYTFRMYSSTAGDAKYHGPSAPITLVAGKWYCLETQFTAGANGHIELWLDGTSIISWSGNTGTVLPNIFLCGWAWYWGDNGARVPATIYIDDVVIADSYIGPIGAAPTQLFADGFETADFLKWSGGAAAGATVVSTMTHHGGYAGLSPGKGKYWAENLGVQHDDFYMRFYVRFPALPAAGQRAIITSIYDDTWAGEVAVQAYNSAGTMMWGLYAPGTEWVNIPSTIAANTWYCVEVRRKTGAGTGTATLWIGGTQLINLTAATISHGAQIIIAGNNGSNDPNFALYDDCYVMATGYIGPE